ncbi:MAG: hypothetical protein KGL69_01025 [Alphaproteobacteria bacterium]|nr:hypothetical protein [Alphaproteobacteria bacterium]
MAFFGNDRVNWLNLHYGLHALAISGGGAFYGAYLLRAGTPLPAALIALAAITAGRFVIRPLIVPVARRTGLRILVIVGTLLVACEFPLLARVHGVGPSLYALVALSAVADTLYWTCYHAYFAALGDAEHRGHQIGAREAIAAVAGIIAPLVAGGMLATLGPGPAFWATSAMLVLSALPLIATPRIAVPQAAPGALKAAWSGVRFFAAEGWQASGTYILWQMVLFVSLGDSFAGMGATLALAAAVGAVGTLMLGRIIDLGHGAKAVGVAFAVAALSVGLKAFGAGQAPVAIAAQAFGALAGTLCAPVLMSAVYNLAKASPCTLRFHAATEGGYDVGCTLGLVVAAVLIRGGAPLDLVLLLPLAGLAAQAVLLLRHYGAEGASKSGDPLNPVATI